MESLPSELLVSILSSPCLLQLELLRLERTCRQWREAIRLVRASIFDLRNTSVLKGTNRDTTLVVKRPGISEEPELKTKGEIFKTRATSNGCYIVSTGALGVFTCWDARTLALVGSTTPTAKRELRVFETPTHLPSSLMFFSVLHTNNHLEGSHVEIWDVAEMRMLQDLKECKGVYGLALSATDTALASSYINSDGNAGNVNLWLRSSATTPEGAFVPFEWKLTIDTPAFRVDFSPNQTRIVTTDRHKINVWDAENGQLLRSFAASGKQESINMLLTLHLSSFRRIRGSHFGMPSPLTLEEYQYTSQGTPHEVVIVGGSGSGSLWMFDLTTGELLSILPYKSSNVMAFYFTSTKRAIVADCGDDVVVWRLDNGDVWFTGLQYGSSSYLGALAQK